MDPAGVLGSDAFYRAGVADLQTVSGTRPTGQPDRVDSDWRRGRTLGPRVILDSTDAEAYAAPADDRANWSWSPDIKDWAIFARGPEGKALAGRLISLKPDGSEANVLKFTLAPAAAAPENRAAFFRAKTIHYERLLSQDIPGGAWFRYQARLAREQSGELPPANRDLPRLGRGTQLEDTYALFTGGRAVSENLQLDRVLPAATRPVNSEQERPVKINTIKGIAVKEIDWKPLIGDAHPALDPLASLIPADQHAAFFPSPRALAAVVELAEKHAVPAVQSFEPQAQTANLRRRYERQLAHGVNDLVALAEAGLIKSVAVTGSDPYLRVGSDLAILLETDQPDELRKRLAEKIKSASGEAKAIDDQVDALAYTGAATDDRSVSAYVAALDKAVVLTNSPAQLRRLAAVRANSAPPLAEAPEYIFFRNRYARGGEDEAGLLILTDATIRRWCGPRWRIADSRRTRVAAVLADLQAQNLDDVVAGRGAGKALSSPFPLVNGGELRLVSGGARSSVYNTLDFMTPIAELDLNEVTHAESESYQRWRDGYQRNWSWAFDPIALRLSLPSGRIAADLTVMPLIDASEYRSLIASSRGASIKPGTGDPHAGALAHLAYALNTESEPVKGWGTTLSAMAPQLKVNPLDWLGTTVAIYVDEDPFWSELKGAKDKADFFRHNIHRLPIGLYAQVRQPLKLAAFLTAARAMIEQSAPGLTQWQTPQYQGRAYVKITANVGDMVGDANMPQLALCYATAPDSLVLSLNEELIHRAIDRQLARQPGAATRPAVSTTAPATQPWLGANLALQVDRRFGDVWPLWTTGADRSSAFLQRLAWGNIPVLNEWKRRFADRDPLEVHERTWGVHLIDPAGGTYVWNESWQTMESSNYGHPADPKPGPEKAPMIDVFERGNFGVDFEPQGIRARAQVSVRPSARASEK
jgi:hypothetical protein